MDQSGFGVRPGGASSNLGPLHLEATALGRTGDPQQFLVLEFFQQNAVDTMAVSKVILFICLFYFGCIGSKLLRMGFL